MKSVEDQDFNSGFQHSLNAHSILLRIRMRSGVPRFTPTSEYGRKKEPRFRIIRNWGCFIKIKEPSAEKSRNQSTGA